MLNNSTWMQSTNPNCESSIGKNDPFYHNKLQGGKETEGEPID